MLIELDPDIEAIFKASTAVSGKYQSIATKVLKLDVLFFEQLAMVPLYTL